MKKLIFNSVLVVSLISWVFLITLTFISLAPSTFIKTIDHYFLSSYSIEFSKLRNSGNALNPNLQFSDFQIKHNEESLLKAKELDLGLTFKPLSITSVLIKDGYFNHLDSSAAAFQNNLLNFNNDISLSFHNFIYTRDNSTIAINGYLNGKLSGSLSSQLSFLHGDNFSSIALDIFENSYRFSLNLHSYKWFSLLPIFNSSPLFNNTKVELLIWLCLFCPILISPSIK